MLAKNTYIDNIIVDGPKAIGKTTVINKIKQSFPYLKYCHLDTHTKNDFNFHLNLIKNKNHIIDRFAFSEIVYSIIMHRKPKIQIQDLEKLINYNSHNLFVIMYTNNFDNLVKKLEIRDNQPLDSNDKEILYLSNELFKLLGVLLSSHHKNVITIKIN